MITGDPFTAPERRPISPEREKLDEEYQQRAINRHISQDQTTPGIALFFLLMIGLVVWIVVR
jgi:hypothetical protein